jgi:ligand-binding sensor domain-containing protein/serine phosphatase RsbU (regulator of sigma subunit)
MTRLILLCVIFVFLFFSNILPQGYITFNHLTFEDGLSQSSVTCIFQDRKGFMWFGTLDGLNRYDGYNFKVFKNDPSDSNSVSDNFIFSIYESKVGDLYFETQSGKFNKYFPPTESFKIVEKDSIDLTRARFSTVGALFEDSKGLKWTGGLGEGTGLKRENIKTGKTYYFKHNTSDPSSLSDDKVYSVVKDRSGNLWVGTFNGLDKLEKNTDKFFHYRNDPNNPNSLPDNWVWPVYEDSRGYLWIGTVKGGLSCFDPRTSNFYNYKNDPGDPTSINDNFIYSIYEDRGGVIWIGTNTGGINYFNPSSLAFEHYKHEAKNKNSLNDNNVFSMLVDRNGNYWIGTRNGGLNKFNYKEKKFIAYYHNPSNSNSLVSNFILSLMEDRFGIIWIGTFSNGLDALDPNKSIFTHYNHKSSDSNTLTDNRIYSIIEDKDDNLWIGTNSGGLNKLDRRTGKVISYQFKKNDSTSISSNTIWSIAQDESGKIWIGTFGGGINVFDQDKQIFNHFKHVTGDSTSISNDNIIRVFKDSKGNMWFGTTSGLSEYLWKSNNFKNYNEKNGLANNTVYGIVEDDNRNLWLSTNNGLSKFNPLNKTFQNYYYEDGLQGNEFNQNAFAKDKKKGRLLFGGINGFNVFYPDSIKKNGYVPPIVFTNYLRYNTDDEEGKPIIEKGISERDSIFLTYKDNIITMDFAALSYFNNSENQYRYRLEGFNKNWIQLGNNHTVTFTNLSQGDYTLHVIGSNDDSIWNEKGASLSISVSPPWWKTKIAYLIYAVIFISSLYGLRRFELNSREQKTKLRENELRLKATEAEKRAIEAENERKTKELEEARQLQLSMLPRELPKLPNLEIAAFMRTATEVGGDYYDFLVQEDGTLNVAFGDATGHGLQAGTMVTLMKGFFTSDSSKLSPQDFMNHCSRMIKEIKLGRILMSFCYLKVDKCKLFITSGGMPPVYFYNKENKDVEEIVIQGMPLGAMRKFSYNLIEKELKTGDTILLLTDGLPEQMNPKEEMFNYSRVKENFNSLAENNPEEIINKLILAGDEWMEGTIQSDDISFVVLKVK